MKTGRRITILRFALSAILIPAVWIPAFSETAARPKNLVVIILNSVRYSDGFGNKQHLYIENTWEKIRPLGTICTNVYNNSVTQPLPAQSVLLTGVAPGKSEPTPELSHPTLFEYYRKQSGALQNKVLFSVGDSGTAALGCSRSTEYGSAFAPATLVNDTTTMDGDAMYDNTSAYLDEHHPSLAVISLSTGKSIHHHLTEKECNVLSQGLKDACGTVEYLNTYYEGIILNDMIIYKLWEKLQTDIFYKDNTIFLVVSSQGRHTDDYSSYGDNCEGCSRLQFLIAGPGVKKNYLSGKKRYIGDILPTIGKLAGIKTEHATGNIMHEVMSDK